MEYMQYIVPTNFCCVIISRTKNDTAILQQEVEKLSILEEECNKKLDEFYASKQEFEFMLTNLHEKMLGDEIDDLTNEKAIIDEFIDYVTSVWQSGADKLGQAQKKIQYISSVEGLPLSVYIQLLQNTIEKASMSIAQTICHPSCTTLFYSMYNEITGELFVRLSTADICFRQYEYLKRSLPFLNKLKDFIKTYIDKEKIYSVKLFSDEIMSGISLKFLGDENYDDKENLGAFRNVVNLLTGKLLGYDYILDPHSEITPIVSDIFTHKPSKKIIVKQLVNFFLKEELESIKNLHEDNYNNKFIINNETFNLFPISLKESERFNRMIDPASAFINLSEPIVDMNGSLYQLQENSGTLFEASSVYDPYQQCLSSTSIFNQAFPNSLFTFENQRYLEPNGKNTKFNSTPQKRGRKANSTIENSGDFNCDLKPIKIPKLKQDLIKPLT